jgi:hypothetical protein
MAALTGSQYTELWRNGQCEQFSLFAVKNVNTGDTVDLSGTFRVILQTTWMGATVSGVANGTFNGTLATAPAGLASAGAFLLVQGVAV